MSNLKFARVVEPENQDLLDYEAACQALRARALPTLPSTLAVERRINPFLRSRESTVRRAVRGWRATAEDETAVFAALRQWKNEFK